MKRWVILNAESNTCADGFRVDSDDVPGSMRGWSVSMHRLRVGLSEGVDVVEVDTGRLRCAILPTRGMGLWRVEVDEHVVGWRSPVRFPVHPKFVNLAEPGGQGFLVAPLELMFRCGLENAGSPDLDSRGHTRYPLHGRIANLPAHYVEVEFDSDNHWIVVRGQVDEVRFLQQKLRLHAEYRLPLNGSSISWADRVENLSGTSASAQLMYHVNVGEPMLQPGWELVAPVSRLCPRDADAERAGVECAHVYPPHDPQSWEQVFFQQMFTGSDGATEVMLRNAEASLGVSLRFNGEQLPYFTQWRNTQASADGYVTGIEPGTNFPNGRTFEEAQGRILTLRPFESWSTELSLDVLNSPEQVAETARAIAALRAGKSPSISNQPLREWSPHV